MIRVVPTMEMLHSKRVAIAVAAVVVSLPLQRELVEVAVLEAVALVQKLTDPVAAALRAILLLRLHPPEHSFLVHPCSWE